MPRLPDRNALGARPTPQSSRGVAGYDGGIVGRAVVSAGQELEQVGAEYAAEQKRQQKEMEAQRKAADHSQAIAKINSARDQLADLEVEFGDGITTGQIDKTRAASLWKERAGKVVSDHLAEIPQAHQQTGRNDLDAMAARLENRVNRSVVKRDQSDTLSGINQTLEYAQRLSVEQPEIGRKVGLATLDQLGPFAGLAPDQITTAKQRFIEGSAYTRGFSAINGAKSDNKALSELEKRIGADKDLDPQRQAQLLAQIDGHKANNEAKAIREAHRAEITAARVDRESTTAYSVLHGWILAGKAVNENESRALLAKLTPTHMAAYRELAAEVPARTAAAMQPLEVQARELDALVAGRNVTGTSRVLEQEITRREQILASAKQEYISEPLRAGAERGVIDAVRPLNLAAGLDGIAGGLDERIEQAKVIATRTGRPVSPLLSNEAEKVGEMLNALPVSQRSERIAQLAASLPPGMGQALAKQINAKDRALALQLAAGTSMTTAGRLTSELIARGAQAVKDKAIKDDNTAITGLRAQAASLVGDSLTGQSREDVIDAAKLIYLGMQSEGSGDMRRAVRLAVGGDIVEHNGKRIPVPAGVDIDKALRTMPPAAVLQQASDGVVYLPGGRSISAMDFVASLPAAQLAPAGAGRYFVRTGGALAMTADGAPIQLNVLDPSNTPKARLPAGMIAPGNIDTAKRPVVKNADGSISTVRSISVGIDGREYLIPTVSDDGKLMGDEQAIDAFRRTGRHLGAFRTPEAATSYAEQLHDAQARAYAPQGRR